MEDIFKEMRKACRARAAEKDNDYYDNDFADRVDTTDSDENASMEADSDEDEKVIDVELADLMKSRGHELIQTRHEHGLYEIMDRYHVEEEPGASYNPAEIIDMRENAKIPEREAKGLRYRWGVDNKNGTHALNLKAVPKQVKEKLAEMPSLEYTKEIRDRNKWFVRSKQAIAGHDDGDADDEAEEGGDVRALNVLQDASPFTHAKPGESLAQDWADPKKYRKVTAKELLEAGIPEEDLALFGCLTDEDQDREREEDAKHQARKLARLAKRKLDRMGAEAGAEVVEAVGKY